MTATGGSTDAFLPLVPSPGRLTLDLGCGEGRVGRDLVAMGHHVVELDASSAMCHATAHHPEAAGRVVVGDAAHLPLATGGADCVVAHMSLQDIDDMEGAVTEIARIHHRALQDYTEALAAAGFLIERVLEPTDHDPGQAWHRIPCSSTFEPSADSAPPAPDRAHRPARGMLLGLLLLDFLHTSGKVSTRMTPRG